MVSVASIVRGDSLITSAQGWRWLVATGSGHHAQLSSLKQHTPYFHAIVTVNFLILAITMICQKSWSKQLSSHTVITRKAIFLYWIMCLRINVTKCLQRLHENKCVIRKLQKVIMVQFDRWPVISLLPVGALFLKVRFSAIFRVSVCYGVICSRTKALSNGHDYSMEWKDRLTLFESKKVWGSNTSTHCVPDKLCHGTLVHYHIILISLW